MINRVADLRRFAMIRRWIGVPAVAGTVVAFCCSGFALAEEKAPAAKPKAAASNKAAGEKTDQPAAEKKPVDPFAVPEGNDPKVISLFLSRLQRIPPKARTPEGILQHVNKLEKVADELLTRELEDELLEQVIGMKFQLLSLYGQLEVEGAAERQSEFLAKAAEDPRPIVANMAKTYLRMQRVQNIGDLKKDERIALVQEIAKDLGEGELNGDEVELAMLAGNTLAETGETEEAVAALNLFAKNIEATGSPNGERIVSALQGTARKLSLPGNPIEISGTKIDGTDFNITELKGKVVLVDFWATWCGPCLAEIPNVAEQYELYHQKGFEVVGISLDEDRNALEEFLAEKKLPWIQLHQNDDSGRGNDNATRYAIQGIPTCILIDQEGKVVSLECRGEKLPELLEKLLGPPEKKPAAGEEKTENPEKSK
jgi:thiol-disulfide isomerase/thioredoxin